MKIPFAILLTFACLQPPGFAQMAQNQKIRFDIDHASFAGESGADLEVYFSVALGQLSFMEQDSLKVARYAIEIKLMRDDTVIDSRSVQRKSALARTKNLAGGETFLSIAKFTQLKAGDYRCLARVEDLNAQVAGQKELEVKIPNFGQRSLDISGIELVTAISRDTTASIYTKRNYRTLPNPKAVYTTANPMLYFYAEVYNRNGADSAAYSLQYRVMREDGSLLRAYPRRTGKHYGPVSAEIGGINVVSFPSGAYELELSVLDSSQAPIATSRKKFYTLRGKMASAEATQIKRRIELLHNVYKTIGLDSINTEFSSAKYLASKAEMSIFKALDLTGKQRFMAEFWARNLDKKTEHEHRFRYANEHFSGLKQGWKTDRGRIFVEHGDPDRIEKNFSLKERRAYETWRYFHVEGGVIFIFVDKGGFDDLQLVHSTAQTELNDPDWRRWVE